MSRSVPAARSFSLVARGIADRLAAVLADQPAARVHGGSINESYRWESSVGPLFVKVAAARKLAMLEAEAAGLDELRGASAVRVPRVLACGAAEDLAYLALEWIALRARPAAGEPRGAPAGLGAKSGGLGAKAAGVGAQTAGLGTHAGLGADARLGEALAHQHRVTSETFGWVRDNTIGSTPQQNARTDDWVRFFREHRLRYQLVLAQTQGHVGRLQQRGAELLDRMDAFFVSYRPAPSLLHGDLWGGNWGVDPEGTPVIFDPAVYYGDREADIAMTRLFGGFGPSFYAAYQAAWPLDRGAGPRTTLYNLYHVLNHLNLFGGGYRQQAETMIDRLLAELAH